MMSIRLIALLALTAAPRFGLLKALPDLICDRRVHATVINAAVVGDMCLDELHGYFPLFLVFFQQNS